jgi:predicted ATPase
VEAQRGQVVGIVGDAVVGKSRLLYEFRQYLAEKRITYLAGRCLSYGQAMSYHPFIEVLRQRCGLTESDSPEAVVEKVYIALEEVGIEPAASAPYLLQLRGMQAGTEPLAPLTPETIKARTFAALRQMSLNGSQRRLLVLAIEELHWSDKTSEEFCDTLVESLAGAAIMVLATYRPGYHPLWIDKPYVTQLALQGLAPHEGILVVRSTQQCGTLAEAVVQMILDKAEGNPFFSARTDEAAKAVEYLTHLARRAIRGGGPRRSSHHAPGCPRTCRAAARRETGRTGDRAGDASGPVSDGPCAPHRRP